MWGRKGMDIVDLYNISFLTKKQTVLLNCGFESVAVQISVPFGFLDKLRIVFYMYFQIKHKRLIEYLY